MNDQIQKTLDEILKMLNNLNHNVARVATALEKDLKK